MGTDPKTIEVANLAAANLPETPSAPTPTPPPEKPFQELEDKLAEYNALAGSDVPEGFEEEPKETPAPPVAPPKAPSPKAPVATTPTPTLAHPPSLINAARNLGIDERHLVPGAVSTEALTDFVVQMRLKDAVLETHPRTNPPPPAPAPKEEDDEATINYLEKEVGADPKLTAFLRKQNEKIKLLEGTQQEVKSMQERDAKRQQASIAEALDEATEKLGPDFAKFLGKGQISTLVDPDEKAARVAVYLAAGIDEKNDTPYVAGQKYMKAARSVYKKALQSVPAGAGEYSAPVSTPVPAPPEQSGKEPVRLTKEEWEKAALAKPNGKAPTKRAEALRRAMQSYIRETTGVGEADELEGVPD